MKLVKTTAWRDQEQQVCARTQKLQCFVDHRRTNWALKHKPEVHASQSRRSSCHGHFCLQ